MSAKSIQRDMFWSFWFSVVLSVLAIVLFVAANFG